MHSRSEEYKQVMQGVIRPQSYMNINIGVINQQAQANAYIENTDDALYLSSFDIFGSKSRKVYYASFEQDYTSADGALLFAPRYKSINSSNGYISSKVIGDGDQFLYIKIDEDVGPIDIKGLMIKFGPSIPIDFDIETDTGVYEVRGNTLKAYETNHVFHSTTYFKITPITMVNQNLRLRIEHVTFGIGLVFGNKLIKTASLKFYTSPVSNDIPQVDLSFEVDNYTQEYNIENTDSTLNFFETGQMLEVQMGQELLSGKVEWMKVATLQMKSWESDNSTAKLTAVDFLESLSGTYYKGRYYEEGISLYDLAIEVVTDMGLIDTQYVIDPYLKTIFVNNPLPKVKHKEALQLIANCGRCVFSINSDGKLVLQSSFKPDYTISSSDEHAISNVGNVLIEGFNLKKYAMLDQNSTDVSGSFYFVPRDLLVDDSFYISGLVSDSSGNFTQNPKISVELEATYNSVGLSIGFDKPLPSKIIITTYDNNELVETYAVNSISEVTNISHNFINFDKMDVEIVSMSEGNTRARVKSFVFGNFTDYLIEYNHLKSTPKGKQLEKVQSVVMSKTSFIESSEAAKQLYKKSNVLDSVNNIITLQFTTPSYEYSAQATGYTCNILESGTYYIKLEVIGLPPTSTVVSLIIMGKQYVQNVETITKEINSKGYSKTWTNILVSDDEVAQDLLDWMSSYYASDREYELSFRGDFALESNDLFYLESQYSDVLLCRIYEHDLTFTGAISSSLKVRREMDV